LREVAGVIREFSGDKDSAGAGVDSPWGVVAEIGKQVVAAVGPALSGMVPGSGRSSIPASVLPQQNKPMIPAAASTPNNGGPSNSSTSMEENLHRWLISQLAFLKVKALAGKDPGFWIDYVFENAEEPGCQALLYTLRRGATFENLLEFDPQIAENPQLTIWFREVFLGVEAGLLQDNVDSGGGSGDARHVAPNVSSGTPGSAGAGSPGVSAIVPKP
jgi:hypothetical protein